MALLPAGTESQRASGDPEAPTQRLGATCRQRWKSVRNEFASLELLQPLHGPRWLPSPGSTLRPSPHVANPPHPLRPTWLFLPSPHLARSCLHSYQFLQTKCYRHRRHCTVQFSAVGLTRAAVSCWQPAGPGVPGAPHGTGKVRSALAMPCSSGATGSDSPGWALAAGCQRWSCSSCSFPSGFAASWLPGPTSSPARS